MLNLSDKELDRLSREAANQHDPGDPTGPASWDKVEIRLNKELGRFSPNPFKAVRRFPFWYAPVILLLVGVSYYIIKTGKGNNHPPNSNIPAISGTEPTVSPPRNPQPAIPPGQGTKQPLSITQNHAYSSTSTPEQNKELTRGTKTPAGAASETSKSQADAATASAGNPAESGNLSSSAKSSASGNISATGKSSPTGTSSGTSSRRRHPSSSGNITSTGQNDIAGAPGQSASAQSQPGLSASGHNNQSQSVNQQPASGTAPGSLAREPAFSLVRAPGSMTRKPMVNDSALRAFTTVNAPIKKRAPSMYVNRRLQFGLLLAPDFSSVNSLAGDRPGSSIGLTIDYQLFDRWHIGTGLLFSRKIYTARPQDYHAPMSYYWLYNMRNVALVKGTFNMLEIPLNLRYDFSVYNNTLFFASAGLSSYLNTNEKASYYFGFLGSNTRQFSYGSGNNYLFSTINLSLGVETGISNSLSLLIAPYVKVPTGGIGFGEVRMSSVGLNFALKFAPVLSRKRK